MFAKSCRRWRENGNRVLKCIFGGLKRNKENNIKFTCHIPKNGINVTSDINQNTAFLMSFRNRAMKFEGLVANISASSISLESDVSVNITISGFAVTIIDHESSRSRIIV